jgi:hypothetical protein
MDSPRNTPSVVVYLGEEANEAGEVSQTARFVAERARGATLPSTCKHARRATLSTNLNRNRGDQGRRGSEADG